METLWLSYSIIGLVKIFSFSKRFKWSFQGFVSVLIFNIPGNGLSIDKSASKVITFTLCILLRLWFVRNKHLNRLFYCLRRKYTCYILFFYSMKWGINLFFFSMKNNTTFPWKKEIYVFSSCTHTINNQQRILTTWCRDNY